ncbi:hypothetical protein AHAS_Ahas18G0116400 [Arachis hypogaea]
MLPTSRSPQEVGSKIRAIAYVFEDIAKDLLSKVMNKHALYLGIARASKLFKKNGMIVL